MKKSRIKVTIVIIFVMAIFAFIGKILWNNYSYLLRGQNHLSLVDVAEDKELFWFDTIHSNNSHDIMFKCLEKEFNKFKPDLVLVEGGFNTFEGDRIEAIKKGESSFAAYLAKKSDVLVEDIEPPISAQIVYLQTKYTPEQILAMYELRQIGSYELMQNQEDIDFEASIISILNELKDNGLAYQGNTVNEILSVINQFLSDKITRDNWKDRKVYHICAEGDSIIHNIYNDVINYRNTYLVSLITEKKKSYHRIFIVMGNAHKDATKEELSNLYSD